MQSLKFLISVIKISNSDTNSAWHDSSVIHFSGELHSPCSKVTTYYFFLFLFTLFTYLPFFFLSLFCVLVLFSAVLTKKGRYVALT